MRRKTTRLKPSRYIKDSNTELKRNNKRSIDKAKNVPVALARAEPTYRTIVTTESVSFPYSIVFLSLICSLLFFFMIFNYVQINECNTSVSKLKEEIAVLSFEAEELTTKLELKNDLTIIEEIAIGKLGMVTADEIVKKYITMDLDDIITPTNNER